jgi:hypothetical protein
MERAERNALDSLKQELDSLYLERLDGDVPATLFHYTDAAGLLGIIDSQKLWATHAFYLNDVTEISHTNELVEEIYLDLIEQAKPDENARLDHNHALWKYRDFLHRLSYKTMRVKPNPDVYVVCFCQDDDLLSQWREYGNRGSGYAIGFDPKRLVYSRYDFKLCKVLYCLEEQKQILTKILKAVTDSLYRLTVGLNLDSAMPLVDAHAIIFEDEVTRYATFFKHKTFSEEKEWRLIYSPTEKVLPELIKFRNSRLGLIPYTEIGFPAGENNKQGGMLPIVSVRIGPTAQPALGRKALEMLAGSRYLNLAVLDSAVPLR